MVQRMRTRLERRPVRNDRPPLPLGADVNHLDPSQAEVRRAADSVLDISPFAHRPASLRPWLSLAQRVLLRVHRPLTGGQARFNDAVARSTTVSAEALGSLNHVQSLQRWRLEELEQQLADLDERVRSLEGNRAMRSDVEAIADQIRGQQ